MDEHNLINSLIDQGERVTGNYAEIYQDDEFCDYVPKADAKDSKVATTSKLDEATVRNEWISPSDLLIGKVDLVPPFTSKITRGITHKGILEIGEAVLQKERQKFLKRLNELLDENDAAWTHIQEEEKKIIAVKVRAIYDRILDKKSSMMQKEISWFYEDTLRELEHHLRCEVRTVIMSNHCSIISNLNKEIKDKLEKERKELDKVLRKRFDSEIRKINKYYKLLLHNENHRSNILVNQALAQRNEALKIFCKQIEAEATTSTMYVMCTERKKCKMRKFLIQNFHSNEIEEKLKVIKEKQDILDEFQRNKRHILDINKEWEEKVKKILQLFLKFISFSLKLLPEQTTFLLDLEKLVVLQLNEIQKYPKEASSILINENDFKNIFEFYNQEQEETVCKKEPFVVEGDLTPSVSTQYGSQDSIPLHKELPYFRIQRQFIYAKCQKIDEVREFLEAQRCKCHDPQMKGSSAVESSSAETFQSTPTLQVSPQSSNELFLVDDIQRLHSCPTRDCQDYINQVSFPNLDEYIDYTQEKFARVQAILGKPLEFEPPPKIIDPKEVVFRELQFAATKELHRDKETQYSSREDLVLPEVLSCPCMDKVQAATSYKKPVDTVENINLILQRRRESLKQIMHENPKLMNLFSEESYDFVL